MALQSLQGRGPKRSEIQKFVIQSQIWVQQARRRAELEIQNIVLNGLARTQCLLQEVKKDQQNCRPNQGVMMKQEIIRYRKAPTSLETSVKYKKHKQNKPHATKFSFIKSVKGIIKGLGTPKKQKRTSEFNYEEQNETFIFAHQAQSPKDPKYTE